MGVMRMLRELPLNEFTIELASENPTPGGGSASAAVAAIGAGLLIMTCNVTIGKEKFKEVEVDMIEARDELEALRVWFLVSTDRDSGAYDGVVSAFRMPKGDPEEKAARQNAIQAATKVATEVPLDVARRCGRALDIAVMVADDGNPNAISDTGCGARFLMASLNGALYNVGINLGSIKDPEYVKAMSAEFVNVREKAMRSMENVLHRVEDDIF
jgi:formiminotetrahydrofolate cyclodeaminase